MDTSINREVLGEVITDLTKVLNNLILISEGKEVENWEDYPYEETYLAVVETILGDFIRRTEGSYYHNGQDGYLARLG